MTVPAAVDTVVLAELSSVLFASLARADQRRRGLEYLRGLLEVDGRKSIRNIAALLDGQATEQSLHHFISESTWNWLPVRRALARYVMQLAPPKAWVVRPIVIPKAGEHSVGVGKDYFPAFGRVLNAQQAVGVWSATEDISSPIDWRLRLPPAWFEDAGRRKRAAIPEDVGPESLGDCAIEAFLGMAMRRELPAQPVVLDARDMDAVKAAERFRATGVPLLSRVCHATRLLVTDRALPGHTGEFLSTYQIMLAARETRRMVVSAGSGSATRTTLVAAVRVRTPAQAEHTEDLLLLGMAEPGQKWPSQIWLTTMTTAQPSALVRLAQLTERVDQDFLEISERVGIRDYAGRTFDGWHRHVTLASAAHVVMATAIGNRPAA
ncbi:IS701 family transposase [Sciscionella sediminilitoris]|uniref:IS701 family transposase n=1 Tax=Sciscionella sediminilitoris TaxID=1445613 RepID=UPI001E2BFDD0|nr:transposase [Sciscionella sp. SE31]